VRLFPATARQRLVVAATAIALGVGASTPLAHADIKHLRHQQAQAQHSVKHAQADLDESSGQARRAYAALTTSRAHLRAARHDLQVALKKAESQANLEVKRAYRAKAADAKRRVVKETKRKKHALRQARRAAAHDRAILRRSKARQARVHRMLMAEIAREQRRGGGFHGDTGGLLMRPVNGPITSPYGWRIHPIYGYRSLHDGIDFGAACGTPIRAAAAGTVLERYFQTAWGNRVIIDHGFHHGVGFTGLPFTITVKWVWQPVDHPVVPTRPTTCPRVTCWPTWLRYAERWL
jgi:murein DD-endopeptidase MepM/ murein hydrolase activator NlpD